MRCGPSSSRSSCSPCWRSRSPGRRLRTVVPLGLLAGALATLAVALLAVPLILLGFDGFFVRFHEVFFSGDTWRFTTPTR